MLGPLEGGPLLAGRHVPQLDRALSVLPEASVLPSGLNATEHDRLVCPSRVARSLPVATSHSRTVLSVAPRGQRLAVRAEGHGVARSVCPFRAARSLPVATSHSLTVWSSPPRRAVLPSGLNATAREVTTITGHTDYVGCVAFSPDGKTLASGSADRTIKLWDVATGQERGPPSRGTLEVSRLAFSPDGKTLASGGGRIRTVKLWDVATGKEPATLKGHTVPGASVAFSPDGKTLASGSRDHRT